MEHGGGKYRRALLEVISIANLWVYLGFDQCCFLGRESDISQVTLLVVPGHRGLSSPGWDSWESTKSGVSKCNVPSEAEDALYANFTTGIETGGSFLASGHRKPTEGTRAETVNSAGVGSPVLSKTGCHS